MEFLNSYLEALKINPNGGPETLGQLIDRYRRSHAFSVLRPRTQKDYDRQIAKIISDFGDYPIRALRSPKSRAMFLDWHDEAAKKSERQADYAMAVLALILAWAHDRGEIEKNPVTRHGKAYTSKRQDRVWSDKDEAKFLQCASDRIRIAYLLAHETGQRQADLLQLTWSQYDGEAISLIQESKGARHRAAQS